MDNNSIATLKDFESSINSSFEKIQKKLSNFDGLDSSAQMLAISSMNNEYSNNKNTISLMRMELANLEEEKNQTYWQQIINDINQKNADLKTQIKEKEKSKKSQATIDDPTDIDAKVDLSKLTSKQAMDRGDNILAADRAAIDRMKNMVNTDLQTMKDVNQELDRQGEALENADRNLTEIDFSLKRASQQMKTMFKMYATDKFIMCMIFIVLIVIVAIIITSLIKGKSNDKNSPKDIFG